MVEPFVGAGSIFLRSHFDEYILNDINPDLINLFQCVKQDVETYIKESQRFFNGNYNNANDYYALRDEFNQSSDHFTRSILFLYLNRFGYNGLCRYNSSGGYNVPFGRYDKPYFPERELRFFAEKAQKATFTCTDFEQVFADLKPGDDSVVVYCDPPYAPISETAYFTSYAKGGFQAEQQEKLAQLSAQTAQEKSIPVVISNHDTTFTRKIYKGAKLAKFHASRSISQDKSNRKKTKELLAIYHPTKK